MIKSIKNILLMLLPFFLLLVYIVALFETINFQNEFKFTIENEMFDKSLNCFYLVFFCFLIIEIMNLIITFTLTKKVKVSKEYIRDTNDILDPILAESIINRKIENNNLIMTCVSNLICKGNIECIDNDKIKLVDYKNLSKYEKRIIKLIFSRVNEVITFQSLNEIFKNENKKTKNFYIILKDIKNDIENELIAKGIYSKKGKNILKIIRTISWIIYANIWCLFGTYFWREEFFSQYNTYIFVTNIIAVIFVAIKEFKVFNNIFTDYMNNKLIELITISVVMFMFLFYGILLIFSTYLELYIAIITVLLVNTFIISKTNKNIFTRKGKEEYKKVCGLKAYIEDYSLMKEKELESTILWDKYLVYAIAFGISNKVTERFKSGLLNTNILLQRIEETLSVFYNVY